MSEKEHAPTPWRAKDTDDGGAIEIYDAEGVYLFDIQMWGGEDGRGRYDDFEEAVAEKLIPRVNAHAALEAELATLRDFCEGVPPGKKGGLKKLVDAARCASKQAERLFPCEIHSCVRNGLRTILAQFEPVEDGK